MRTALVLACCALTLGACSTSGGAVATTLPGTTRPAPTQPSATSAASTEPPPTPTSTAATPVTSPPSTAAAEPVEGLPEGFDLVAARVTEPDGSTCDLCLWLAETSDQRLRGLMFVTDLGPASGMAFRYERAHTGTFWMKDTLLPLSIAFFAPDGSYMTEFDMEPCTTPTCRRYGTPAGFLVAVETLQGGLDELGMVPGSRIELLGDPCG